MISTANLTPQAGQIIRLKVRRLYEVCSNVNEHYCGSSSMIVSMRKRLLHSLALVFGCIIASSLVKLGGVRCKSTLKKQHKC
ncbi:hypothetical protein LOK49_LG02G01459 [Camellia lanceoleosa]|uniref:Uncharacterized protein n=1 Tax=Camellia lanceoleosa TaxID=1840588 RepID=A0ACC0IIH8_9ERIC|nr:hypothetical protein LOK49_LG02G01459 [Camellia lanceoleosa]